MEPQPGFYRHFKGELYEVLGIGQFGQKSSSGEFLGAGFHSEDLSSVQIYQQEGTLVLEGSDTSGLDFVVYQAQYDTDQFGSKPIWVRPREMFVGTKKEEGKEVPRFTFMGIDNPGR